MSFERFTKIGSSFSPKISIRSNGQIGFSRGAVKKFKIEEYQFCELYYDKEEKLIGLNPTDSNDEQVVNIYIKENNCYIATKTFLDYFEIDYTRTMSFIGYIDDDSGYIILDLKKGTKSKRREVYNE